MSDPASIFLLDEVDSKILDLAMLRASQAGVSTKFAGRIRSETGIARARQQWKADVLLYGCFKQVVQTGGVSVVLTGRDLYVGSLNFVFGLARRDLQAAMVSWHRLIDERAGILADRLSKEIVHEVGHLEGLEHCKEPSCVMWFSNTLHETDAKGVNFCHSCLQKRGETLIFR